MSSKNTADDDDVDDFLYGSSKVEDLPIESANNGPSAVEQVSKDDELDGFYKEDAAKELGKETQPNNDTRNDVDMIGDEESKEDKEENDKEEEKEEEEEEEEEEEDDSDDDLEIVLESEQDQAAKNASGQTAVPDESKQPGSLVSLKPGQQANSTTTLQAGAPGAAAVKPGGVDLNAIGEHDGQPITEIDTESLEDKPWRKPGADITDYFNYGFNENTWRAYCDRQKMLRGKPKMMGDMDPAVMSMGMMMPPGMMPNMPNMPNMQNMQNMMMGMSPMGMPMGMPPPGFPMGAPGGGAGMRGPGRGMPMGRSNAGDGEHDGKGGPMGNSEEGRFPMNFSGGMPPYFSPNMGPPPMGLDGGRDGNGPPRGPSRGSSSSRPSTRGAGSPTREPSRSSARGARSPSSNSSSGYPPHSSSNSSYHDGGDHRDSRKRNPPSSSHDDYRKRTRN